jgi:membrane-associated phospholipid phosphatase
MSEAALSTPVSKSKLLPLLGLSFRVHWPFFMLALAYTLTTQVLVAGVPNYKQAPLVALVVGFISFSLPAGIVAVFLFRLLLQYPLSVKPDSPVKQMGRDIAELFKSPRWLVTGVPLLLAMILFNKSMLELKPLIPAINAFSWDQTFMQLDRNLHFGVDPWVLLQPLMGYDAVSFVTNILYNFWFLALFGTFVWFGFARRADVVRTQFFLAYMLTWWIGGGLLAVYFSSAGPVYYSNIGLAPDPFTPLMDYLKDVNTRLPIWSLQTQQLLWDGHIGKSQAIGISAFPSMHNASSLLFALAAWKLSRKAGIVFGIYCMIILVGSVHLGWHYAVDGYAGLLLAAACWWVAGFVARWHARLASTQRLNGELARL